MFPETGQIQLQIAGRLVLAQSNMPLTQGRSLNLEVIKDGDVPQLKIRTVNLSNESISNAARASIGTQKSPIDLSEKLISILKTTPQDSPVSEPVRKLANSVLQTLPHTSDLSTAPGLKRAIENSGIFLEAKLLALAGGSDPSLNADMKTKILRLLDRLGPTEINSAKSKTRKLPTKPESSIQNPQPQKTLEEQVKGVLSKIVLDQLTSLPEDSRTKQSWNLEIPFMEDQQASSVKLIIDREQRHNNNPESQQWSVFIELQPPKLGMIQAKITVTEQGVNAYFRATHEDTNQLIQNNIALLREQLQSMGLQTGELGSRQGQFDNENSPTLATRILDEKA